jgi:hypothetical protein
VRAPPPPSSSASWIVPEVNSGSGQARGWGWRVTTTRIWVPLSSDVGGSLEEPNVHFSMFVRVTQSFQKTE